MIEVQAQVEIDRPAGAVWSVLADYARDPAWRAGVLAMDPEPAGPVRVGTRTAERMRFAGRLLHNDGEVLAVVPGVRFAWRTTSGVDAEGAREVQQLDGGRCRVHLLTRVRPHGIERFYAPLAALVLRRRLNADARRLRALLDDGPRTGAAPAAGPRP